jgi:hypothetical protein
MKNSSITKLTLVKSYAAAAVLASFAVSANAAPVPYADAGVENPYQYTFTAIESGDIIAYFVGKGGADFSNNLGMTVNGVPTGTTGLNNQSSSFGEPLNLGFANAGDTIVFTLNVTNTGNTWYSNKSLNADNTNHVYAVDFSGEDELIPTGAYVAFEDLAKFGAPNSDFNYLDEQFVVTNVAVAPAVPVPAAAWLFGSAVLGLAGVTRSRSKKA